MYVLNIPPVEYQEGDETVQLQSSELYAPLSSAQKWVSCGKSVLEEIILGVNLCRTLVLRQINPGRFWCKKLADNKVSLSSFSICFGQL